jgi:hypothetical protein
MPNANSNSANRSVDSIYQELRDTANRIINKYQYKLSRNAKILLKDHLIQRSQALATQNPLTHEHIRKENIAVANVIDDLLETHAQRRQRYRRLTITMLKKAFGLK